MMKLKKNFSFRHATLLSLYAVICAIVPANCHAKDRDGLEILRETSKAFASLAKNTTPAVVFIETDISQETTKQKNEFTVNPFDFFHDDFFNRFFGMPFQESKPKAKKEKVYGSGFLISADGYILTNSHVVQDADVVTVTMQGDKKFTAKIIGTDAKTDVAVIKIESKNLPFISLGDSSSLEVGEWVMAIGNPFGLEASVTVGVVSAKGRNQLHLTDFDDFIQTDAAINPGNSGGPLINMDGKVIGMNTAIVSPHGGGYIGIGFAVPSNLMLPVMNQLIKSGKVTRGFLGVALQPVDADLAQSFGLDKPEGALIAEVVKGSPAESAGLKSGDIITQYNGARVTNINQFRTDVSLMNPGTKLNLGIYRDGKPLKVSIVVGTQSEPATTKAEETPGTSSEQLGLVVQDLTPEFARKFGYDNDQGVIVTKVTPGSLGEEAGIQPGALVMAIDRKKVASVSDFNNAVTEALKAKRILLLIKQGAATRYIALKF